MKITTFLMNFIKNNSIIKIINQYLMKYIPVIVDKKGNIKNLKKHSFLVVEMTLYKNIKKIKK